MIVSLVKLRKRLKFVILLIMLSSLLFLALQALTNWLQPQERYREPGGRAVKVIQQEAVRDEGLSMLERLRMFYRYGE